MITLDRHLPDVYGSPAPERGYGEEYYDHGCGPSDASPRYCWLHDEELCAECRHEHGAVTVWAYDWDAEPIVNEDLGTRSRPITEQMWCTTCVESSRLAREVRQCHGCRAWYHVDVDEVEGGRCMTCHARGCAA